MNALPARQPAYSETYYTIISGVRWYIGSLERRTCRAESICDRTPVDVCVQIILEVYGTSVVPLLLCVILCTAEGWLRVSAEIEVPRGTLGINPPVESAASSLPAMPKNKK